MRGWTNAFRHAIAAWRAAARGNGLRRRNGDRPRYRVDDRPTCGWSDSYSPRHPCRMVAEDAASTSRRGVAGRAGDGRLQPRALHPQPRRWRRDAADARQRPGLGAGAGDARLRRHLDRARQRLAPTAKRSTRNDHIARAAGRSRLYAAPGLAHARRSRTATTTASPTKASGRSAISPSCGRSSATRTGSTTWGQPALCRRRRARRRSRDDPIVLVQDYHFALLPRMIRERLPQRDDHHVLAHPLAQSRRPSASARGARRSSTGCSAARSSASTPSSTATTSSTRSTASSRAGSTASMFTVTLRRARDPGAAPIRSRSNGRRRRWPASRRWPNAARRARSVSALQPMRASRVGVERFDYTKGISSACSAVERPARAAIRNGAATSCSCRSAAPTRSKLDAYRDLRARCGRDGRRRSTRDSASAATSRSCSSIRAPRAGRGLRAIPRGRHLHRLSSLHDGMNLVAKEFVAARDDEQGVLDPVELHRRVARVAEALIVNPYDTHDMAEALDRALRMAAGGAARAHARDARLVRRAQCLSLGGAMLLDAARLRRREHQRCRGGVSRPV